MPDSRADGPPTRRPDSRQILTGVAIALLFWFAVSNWQTVTIHFWVTTAKAPQILVIVLSALLGGVVIRFARRRGAAPKHR